MRKHLEGISQPELSKSLKAVFHFGVTVAKMTVLLSSENLHNNNSLFLQL